LSQLFSFNLCVAFLRLHRLGQGPTGSSTIPCPLVVVKIFLCSTMMIPIGIFAPLQITTPSAIFSLPRGMALFGVVVSRFFFYHVLMEFSPSVFFTVCSHLIRLMGIPVLQFRFRFESTSLFAFYAMCPFFTFGIPSFIFFLGAP